MEIHYGNFTFGVRGNNDDGLPAPRVNFSYDFDTTSAGQHVGSTLNITLNGQIYEHYGDDTTHGASKATGIEQAFKKDYQPFTIKCGSDEVFPNDSNLEEDIANGIHTTNISFNNSSDEYWRNIIDYEITLAVPIRLAGGEKYIQDNALYVSSLDDSWSVSEEGEAIYRVISNSPYYPSGVDEGMDSRYFNVSRTISAQGKKTDLTALENARKAVASIIDKAPNFFGSAGTSDGNLTIYNRSANYEADTVNGSLTFTENYKAFLGPPTKHYIHTYTINNTIDDKLKRTVTVNGTIQGFHYESQSNRTKEKAKIDDTTHDQFAILRETKNQAYVYASGGFNQEVSAQQIYYRVRNAVKFPSGDYIADFDATQSYEDFKLGQPLQGNRSTNRAIWIHPVALSFTSEHNPNEGSITYNAVYDNRPLNLIGGAITETLSVSDKYPTTGYSSKEILYRGSIMQSLGTTTTPSRTVSYTATFPYKATPNSIGGTNQGILPTDSFNNTQIKNIFEQFDPKNMHVDITSWTIDDNFDINFIEGSFNKTKTWNYTLYKE